MEQNVEHIEFKVRVDPALAPRPSGPVTLSIVVPAHNEEKNIRPLFNQIKIHLDQLKTSYEVIFVDDGSRDGTWKEIRKLAEKSPHIKGLSLSRNFGHQNAILSGYSFSSGQAIISLDGDLQHSPELIPQMVREWEKGFKVVNTQRFNHQKTSLFKKLTSKYYYRFFSFLTEVPIAEGASDYRLIDRQVLDAITKFNDLEFFFRGIVSWVGFPTTSVKFHENERFFEKSKYSLLKMIRFALSGLIAFSAAPLKIGIWLGLLTSFMAFVQLIVIIINYYQGVTVPGWATIVCTIYLLFGILFILLGCIGLYVANIHENLKNRPRFIINEKINFDKDKPLPNASSQ